MLLVLLSVHFARTKDSLELQDTRTRKTKPSQRDLRRKQLDVLKARREGKQVNDLEATVNKDQDSEDSEDRRMKRLDQSDEDDRDFVVDDDDDEEKGDGLQESIPLELTFHAHKRPIEYFKTVVEWLVHKKLNPAFNREDQLYRMSFRKVDDTAKGFAGSKFVSSIWKESFNRALQARPKFKEDRLVGDSSLLANCEACGRSGHPATFRIRFTGKAYYPDTLENIKEEDDDDEDETEEGSESDSAASYDRNQQALPPESRQFYVGSKCRSNASVAHSLLHWKWHLNDWVLNWLEAEGHTTAEKILERDTWSMNKRGRCANEVVDGIEASNVIKELWKDFRTKLNEAGGKEEVAYGRVGW